MGSSFVLISGMLFATQMLAAKLWLLPNGDVDEYQQYAIAFWTQQPIGHALPVEYPPLAIAPFTLTLVPPGINPHITFGIWMGVFVLAGYYASCGVAGRARALMYLGYLLLSCAATLLARFDIVPALVTLSALWAAERRRFGTAYVLLAVGVLLKLYPIFLLPVLMIAHWQAMSGDGAAVALPALVARATAHRAAVLAAAGHAGRLARDAALSWAGGGGFRRRAAAESHGGADESVLCRAATAPGGVYPGLAALALDDLRPAGAPRLLVHLAQLRGAARRRAAPALDGGAGGGCLWVYWRQARGKLTLGQAFLACICVVLATNKIFSPQYLIWVVPLVAYVVGLDWIWVAICFLTWLDFPIMYQWEHPIWRVPFSPLFMPALALRNGLLLWVTLRAIIRPRPAVMLATAPRRARDGTADTPRRRTQ